MNISSRRLVCGGFLFSPSSSTWAALFVSLCIVCISSTVSLSLSRSGVRDFNFLFDCVWQFQTLHFMLLFSSVHQSVTVWFGLTRLCVWPCLWFCSFPSRCPTRFLTDSTGVFSYTFVQMSLFLTLSSCFVSILCLCFVSNCVHCISV